MAKKAKRAADEQQLLEMYRQAYDKHVEPRLGCWLWQGYIEQPTGYGRVYVNGKKIGVHRIALYLDGRPPTPEKNFALHTCNNRSCVFAGHLYPGDAKQNARDMVNADRSPFAKLTVKQVALLKADLARMLPIKDIAKKYKVSARTVYNIRAGNFWGDIAAAV